MARVAAAKHSLFRTRDRLEGELRVLGQRVNRDFAVLAENLENLESALQAASAFTRESAPEIPDESPRPAPAAPLAAGEAQRPRSDFSVPETSAASELPPLVGTPATDCRAPGLRESPAAAGPQPVPAGQPRQERPERPPPFAGTKSADGMAELRFGQKWLLIAGVVIMVLGLGYFLKYSFDQNWIGPAGRVALAYLAGIFCLGAGEGFRRAEMYRGFGFALMGGGIAILYFSGFAAFQLYELISQSAAFGLLVLVTLLTGALAYTHNAQWMAVLGLIGGFATPVVLQTGHDNQVALMTYMAVLNLAVLGLARVRTWPQLTSQAFLFTWLLFAGWFFNHYAEEKFWTTTLFLNLFYVIHFLAPVAYCLGRESRIALAGFATALPNAFIAFGFSHYTISRYASMEHVGLLTLAYALMAVALASWLRRRSLSDRRPFVMLLFQGILFLVITVPVVFSHHWITAFWAVQAAALMWAAGRLDGAARASGRSAGARTAAVAAVLLLLGALGKLYLYDYAMVFGMKSWMRYHPNFAFMIAERWLTLGAALAALAAAAVQVPAAWRSRRSIFLGLFAALLFISLTLEVGAYFGETAPAARFAALSVLWGLYAAALLGIGFARRSSVPRKTGIGLFGLTAAKIFLVDMANAGTPFRIISFVALGLLLIGASFLYYYGKDRLLRAAKDDHPAPGAEEKENL